MKNVFINKSILLIAFISTTTLSFLQLAHSADIYKTVDENGKVTYSDKITSDKSVKLEAKELNTVPPAAPAPPKQAEQKSLIPTEYQITISSPANESHINPDQRDVTVEVSTVPNVYIKHTLQISDNGSLIAGSSIKNITRGTHILVAIVKDERGRVISRSSPVTIYVHRPTVKR
ncbi:MAG: DUF4124 domain-containing protein [Cellvibrionaceae bacterium]